MRIWQSFEMETQRLYSALLSDTSLRDLFLESNKYHERIFFDLATRLMPSDIFLEIGAYEGSTSQRVAAKNSGTNCYAFEADPSVYNNFFDINVTENTLENYKYINNAVSDRTGSIEFYKQLVTDLDMDADLLPNNSALVKPSTEYKSISVPSTTVDDFLEDKEFGTVTLRIDVEGLCYEVLVGSGKTLAKTNVIYAEVEDFEIWEGQKTVFDLYGLLDDAGFYPVTRDVQTPGQYNVLFLREYDLFRRAVRAPITLFNRRMDRLNQIALARLEAEPNQL